MAHTTRLVPLTLALLLTACATVPNGPSVMALPGSGKTNAQFRSDDGYCRQFALDQIGGRSADDNAVDSGVRSAALGTLLGAAAGAIIGGHNGAGVGAGTGLVFGAIAGTGEAEQSARGTRQRYDIAYVQCMYDQGNRVPVSGRLAAERPRTRYTPPPPPSGMAPPPPMTAPPPVAIASDELFVYPKGGQSAEQTATDRRECASWATKQTGFEPTKDAPNDPRRGDYNRASAACLESHGYTVR
jgi:outer membrane lipoprotein SlyB